MAGLGLALAPAVEAEPALVVDRACELVAVARPELSADQDEVPAEFVAPEPAVAVEAEPASVLTVASGYSSRFRCDYSRHSSFQKIKHLAVLLLSRAKEQFLTLPLWICTCEAYKKMLIYCRNRSIKSRLAHILPEPFHAVTQAFHA